MNKFKTIADAGGRLKKEKAGTWYYFFDEILNKWLVIFSTGGKYSAGTYQNDKENALTSANETAKKFQINGLALALSIQL